MQFVDQLVKQLIRLEAFVCKSPIAFVAFISESNKKVDLMSDGICVSLNNFRNRNRYECLVSSDVHVAILRIDF
jgi:hypothetical protein